MKAGRVSRVLGAGVLGSAFVGAAARCRAGLADSSRPSDVPDGGDSQSDNAGALALRIDRLEAALRRATGQIEELQNDNRKLADKLKRFRDDVEFRLSGKSGAAALPAPGPGRHRARAGADQLARARRRLRSRRRPDRARRAQADGLDAAERAAQPVVARRPRSPSRRSSRCRRRCRRSPRSRRTTSPASCRRRAVLRFPQQFESAKAAYKAGQYADAEAQFKAYLDANKGVSNAADAVFYIGETYMQRARAARGGRAISEGLDRIPESRVAPDAMVRLGLALAKLGNNEQACATFAEVGRRYPTAPHRSEEGADREIQAHRCS